jgi:hypothetical protein
MGAPDPSELNPTSRTTIVNILIMEPVVCNVCRAVDETSSPVKMRLQLASVLI